MNIIKHVGLTRSGEKYLYDALQNGQFGVGIFASGNAWNHYKKGYPAFKDCDCEKKVVRV